MSKANHKTIRDGTVAITGSAVYSAGGSVLYISAREKERAKGKAIKNGNRSSDYKIKHQRKIANSKMVPNPKWYRISSSTGPP